jgi:ankyrin repeat protein
MKYIVANVRKIKGEDVVISFFFNARGEDLEKSTLGMYRSLLYQLLKTFPDLQIILKDFESRFPQDGGSYTLEEEDLKAMFTAAIKSLKQRRLICFIDALDECDEDEIRDLVTFLEKLGQLATLSQIHFIVCLSSRHYPYISIKNGVELILEGQEGHVQDIARYLNSELRAGSGKQFEEIKEEILTRASGIFLWVALVVQIMNKEYDHGRIHALRRRLREIPDGLDKLFEDILTRDRENTKELILCLQWILYAKRPLRREELYYAILSGTDHETLSVPHSDGITVQDMDRFILSCSKGLAETTRLKAQTVQFIHESVRDFLLGKTGVNKLELELGPSQSHERLKQCCCIYMKSDISNYLPPSGALPVASTPQAGDLRRLVFEKFPFLEYAVRNVLSHADVADGYGISQQEFLKNFALDSWIKLDNLFEKYQVRRHTSNASLLYICTEKSLSNLIRTQLKQDPCPETAGERSENERYAAPLYAALANAKVSEDTIRALLIPVAQSSDYDRELHHAYSDGEIDCHRDAINTLIRYRPNLDPRKGHDLIGWAVSNGHEAVVKLLLAKYDIDGNLDPRKGYDIMRWAASGGHEAVVKLLLATNENRCHLKDKEGQTPLFKAALNGHEAVVKLLLARSDIEYNLKDRYGQTPLFIAASNGHEAVVKLLLARSDIECHLKNKDDQTPLYKAASNGHEAVVKLLLARSEIECHLRNKDDQTPLFIAASKGHDAVVKLLLARSDIMYHLRNKDGQTPLFMAASNGHEAVLKLLLARDDIDVNVKDDLRQTPLFKATSHEHETIVKLLLAKDDIDVNVKDNLRQTSLFEATSRGHETIVKLLLARDEIDVNAKDDNHRTSLFKATSLGHEAIVKLLLARDDIDVNAKDIDHRTPLFKATSLEHETIVKLLLARDDIDVNVKDSNDRTSLFVATSRGHEGIVKLLLARDDIDVNVKDEYHRTSLFLTTSLGHETIVKLLLARDDIDINVKDSSDRTSLSVATFLGHEGIVKLLLARDDIDVNVKDNEGHTALFEAQSRGHERIVNLLLARQEMDQIRWPSSPVYQPSPAPDGFPD